MRTLKSCEIQDAYKHVCFKDLEDYIRKDGLYDTLKGLCQIELDKIKSVLGINSVYVDKVLKEYSPNAIANGTVTAALREKVSRTELAQVAFSGDYNDLIHKPCHLPNPCGLMVVGLDGSQFYDGGEPVKINIPTDLSQLTDETGLLSSQVDLTPYENVIESISVNGVKVNPDECKNVNIQIEQPNLNNYVTKQQYDSDMQALNNTINNLRNALQDLEARLDICCPVDPDADYYTITKTDVGTGANKVIISYLPSQIIGGTRYESPVVIPNNVILNSVTVMMGGSNITASAWDATHNRILIDGVSGNVEIIIDATNAGNVTLIVEGGTANG